MHFIATTLEELEDCWTIMLMSAMEGFDSHTLSVDLCWCSFFRVRSYIYRGSAITLGSFFDP